MMASEQRMGRCRLDRLIHARAAGVTAKCDRAPDIPDPSLHRSEVAMRGLQLRIKIMLDTIEKQPFSVLGQARKKGHRVYSAGAQVSAEL
jgi:hypothetical protein